MSKKIIARATDYADRHELAEMEFRGLTELYSYARIYNAEITAYINSARETLELVKKCIYKNIDANVAEKLILAIEKDVNA